MGRDLSVMMLAIIFSRRSVLHGEQGAILCDSWFHIPSAGLSRRAMLEASFAREERGSLSLASVAESSI